MIPHHLTSKQCLTCGDYRTGSRLTIVIVYSCLREFIVLSSNTTIPPPSTVSTVLAKRLGVRASKSCETQKAVFVRVNTQSWSPTFSGIFHSLWCILVLFCSQRGVTHLQDAHAEGVAQDLVGLVVVTVADVGRSDEEFKRVILIQVQGASFYLLLQLPHALLPIAVSHIFHTFFRLSKCEAAKISERRFRSPAEAQVFFVAPEYRGSCSDGGFGQHVVQNDNLDHRKPLVTLNGSWNKPTANADW